MANIAKFTYNVYLSCMKDASDNNTILYQEWSKNDDLRQATFKRQEDTFNKSKSMLAESTFTIQAYSYNHAIRLVEADLATQLDCTVKELMTTHYICTHARIVNDARTRRILRRRSLSERSNSRDTEGMALPYLEAMSHRTDFDTHYMNIAEMLPEPTRSEFLNAYEDY